MSTSIGVLPLSLSLRIDNRSFPNGLSKTAHPLKWAGSIQRMSFAFNQASQVEQKDICNYFLNRYYA
jgi:hypothetical protein